MAATPTPLFPEHEPRRVKVQLPLPLGGAYDYLVPAEQNKPPPGSFVRVPLGPRHLIGVVWPDEDESGNEEHPISADRLKAIEDVFDFPPLSPAVLAFIDWVAQYTLSDRGIVLRLVMRSGKAVESMAPLTTYVAASDIPANLKRTPQREKVLALNSLTIPQRVSEIAGAAGVSDAVVRGLIKGGALSPVVIDADPPFAPLDPHLPGRSLSPDQEEAAKILRQRVSQGQFSTTLLDGVTGSGKTEVYLEAVAETLKDPHAQVCILLPEIALTLPFLKRVEERFGAPAAHWHSDVSSRERRRVWRRIAGGNARLVIGARSALFLPYNNLRLIVVDEEHEAAYKQHDGVLYQARDMAVARASLNGFPVILASATPSLETLANVEEGRYGVVSLPSRFGPATLPATKIVDMRNNPTERGEWLSPVSIKEITQTLERKEQVLLYLNRRGYAPVTLCRKCGERMTAPNSDTWLVEHKYTNRLVCHHTGYSIPKPDHCPHCGAPESLTGCGPGVERIAEEAEQKWPDARVEIFSSDTVNGPGAAKALLRRMTEGEIDILVATQAAAKGHNFPGLTLVVAVDADLGLAGGDLRAAERTFQTLSQVAGRAGRADKPGRVLLQSYQPDHPVIGALARFDRDGFAGAELDGRASLGFPPYGRLAAIILSGDNETKLNEVAQQMVSVVPQADGIEIWGPAPAPLYRLRGTYRIRFLVKVARRVSIQAVLRNWLAHIKVPASVRRTVDIDPYSFT